MTIYDIADLMQIRLIVEYSPFYDGPNKWGCRFESCETKPDSSSSILSSGSGWGPTPQEAINDYQEKIKGKWMVHKASDEKYRKEFQLPNEWGK